MSARSELPLPDYDHLPVNALGHRIRTLDSDGITTLLAYEREHGNRLPVITVLENRLAELREGARPTEGSPSSVRPEQAPAPSGKEHASPQTQGPTINPPSQGDPSNPAQPRSTG
jgi:hypothetical protein